MNGTISGFHFGIFTPATSVTIHEVSFRNNDFGYFQEGGHGIQLLWDTFEGNGSGAYFVQTFGLTVMTNTFVNNGAALHLSQSGSQLERNSVINSDFRNNKLSGMELFESSDTQIKGNRFLGSPVGLRVRDDSAGDNQVTWNQFVRDRVGFLLGGSPFGNDDVPNTVVANNVFRNDGAAGPLVSVGHSVKGSTVSENRFVHNGFDPGGVTDPNGATVDDGANIFLGAGVGDLTLSNNTAYRNADYGIEAVGVIDGGGNTAQLNGNPDQCLGVAC